MHVRASFGYAAGMSRRLSPAGLVSDGTAPMPVRCGPRPLAGRLEVGVLRSCLLQDNPLGDPPQRDVLVYVPPGYDEQPSHRFPVVLLLPAFGSSPWTLVHGDLWKESLVERLDARLAGRPMRSLDPSLVARVFTSTDSEPGEPGQADAVKASLGDRGGALGNFGEGPPLSDAVPRVVRPGEDNDNTRANTGAKDTAPRLPFLLVIPDATTCLGGSQYLDSPINGAYQGFLCDEVLPWVDAHYRTVPTRQGRAVLGRSSGGFGALRLLSDRPGLFGAVGSHAGDAAFAISLRPMLHGAATVYALDGGIKAFASRMRAEGPTNASDHTALFCLAAACAYAPEPLDPFSSDIPFPVTDKYGELDEALWRSWLSHDPLIRLADLRGAGVDPASTTLVFLDAGDKDEHGLHFAARQIRRVLMSQGVPIAYAEYPAGHRGTRARYEQSIPTLVAALVRQW